MSRSEAEPWKVSVPVSAHALRLTNELGNEFPVRYDAPIEQLEATINRAVADAEAMLPPGIVYEIRGKVVPNGGVGNYGRDLRGETDAQRLARRTADWGVAWYWTSAEPNRCYGGMRQAPLFRRPVADAEENELGGFLVIARLRTPNR